MQPSAIPRLPKRPRDGHKGTFGHVLVIAGSNTMPGAAALATLGALRGGAGLVTLASTESVLARLTPVLTCALQRPLESTREGCLAPDDAPALLADQERYDVCVLGPGLSQGAGVRTFLDAFVNGWRRRLVLDADGLNLLAADRTHWPSRAPAPRCLTPHPGEFARLMGRSCGTSDAERGAGATALAQAYGAFALLKGARTVVTDGVDVRCNLTGNPGMGTGGSGDVLAGVVGALLARRDLEPLDALHLACHVHGLAGDLFAQRSSETALTAHDLLDQLPAAFRELETASP
ncbi:MAG: NAD(P)H-hydrate dehydratase [Planctomycetes bacterium]|nr:NAD(P)H-hydrate dehydratase [Planctomycetota bacterium]